MREFRLLPLPEEGTMWGARPFGIGRLCTLGRSPWCAPDPEVLGGLFFLNALVGTSAPLALTIKLFERVCAVISICTFVASVFRVCVFFK